MAYMTVRYSPSSFLLLISALVTVSIQFVSHLVGSLKL